MRPRLSSGRGLSPGRGLSSGRAAWRLATGGAGPATAAVGVLIFACVFLAVAGPREGVALRSHALQQSFGAELPVQRTVYASLNDTALTSRMRVATTSAATLVTVQSDLRRNLAALHLPLAPAGTDWAGLTSPLNTLTAYAKAAAPAGIPPQLELAYRGQLSRYTTLVSGALPRTATQGADGTTLQIAVTTGTAATLHLRVGSRLGDGLGTTLIVTGIVRPGGAASAPFWAADPLVYAPPRRRRRRPPACRTGPVPGSSGPANWPCCSRRWTRPPRPPPRTSRWT